MKKKKISNEMVLIHGLKELVEKYIQIRTDSSGFVCILKLKL